MFNLINASCKPNGNQKKTPKTFALTAEPGFHLVRTSFDSNNCQGIAKEQRNRTEQNRKRSEQ